MNSLLTIRKGLLLGFFVAVLTVNFAFSQNCSATLSVEKDRNVKSAYEDDAASFNLVLTNTSSKSMTYVITTKNLQNACSNDIHKNTGANVPLTVDIKGDNLAGPTANALTLAAGETRKFRISVSVPPSTPKNRWSCIEVMAQGRDCNQPADTTTLRVYVPKPSDG